jgi:transcription elongation factor Elf1
MIKKFGNLNLGYNHKVYKRTKIKCKHCGRMVRRDYMASHQRKIICKLKKEKYNKNKTVSCKLCGAKIRMDVLSRHQKTKKCKSTQS